MRLTLLVAAMLIGTGTAAQAAVYAFASNNSSTWDQERPLEASVDTGATYQGIWTVDDFQTNQARASANARYGEMRIFARDAGDDNITASGARARIEDTLTITGPQGGVPVTATLRMRAEADLNTLTNQTGGPVGGRADTQFWSELSVSAERTPVFNRSPVEHRGSVGFRHLAGHGFVRGENDSIIEEVIPSGPTILERGRITPTRFRGGTPSENPVQATRLDFERNAVGNVAALMEVDFLV